MGHTKGPWKIEPGREITAQSTRYEGEEFLVAKVAWRPTQTEMHANAALISAAPNMLAALRLAEWGGHADDEERYCPVCFNNKCNGHAKDCELALAIAMAEGRAA